MPTARQGYREAMVEYRRAKANLKKLWEQVSALRGDAYADGLIAYQAEKQRVKELYREIEALGSRRSPASDLASRTLERATSRTPGLARELTTAFVAGELDLSGRSEAPEPGWAGMPECNVVERMHAAGASDAEARMLLTFPRRWIAPGTRTSCGSWE